MKKGSYWKGDALGLPSVEADMLQETHDTKCAGQVGAQVLYTMSSAFSGGLAWLRTIGSMSRAATCVSTTTVCKGRQVFRRPPLSYSPCASCTPDSTFYPGPPCSAPYGPLR